MPFLHLPDGRDLDILVSGPEDGVPLVYHHGTPGSVTPATRLAEAAYRHGLRLVTMSRAGYGLSSRDPGRTVASVADDVAAVLDHLGASRCVTAGWSGGGPHALATGALLSDRVAGVLVIAGVAPYQAAGLDFLDGMGEDNLIEFGAALDGEASLRAFLEGIAPGLRAVTAEDLVSQMGSLLPDVDRAMLTDEFGAELAGGFCEALEVSVDGWLDDDLAFVRPWGFDLDALSVPSFIWQGGQDLMVPPAHGGWLAEHVRGAQPRLLPDEGHVSIVVGKIDEMVAELASTL